MKKAIILFFIIFIVSCSKNDISDNFKGKYDCQCTRYRITTPISGSLFRDTLKYDNLFLEVKANIDSLYTITYFFDSFNTIWYHLDAVKVDDSIFEHPRYFLGFSGKVYDDYFLTSKGNILGSPGTGTTYESTICKYERIKN